MNIYDENTLTSRSKITQPTIISLDIKNALQIIETGRNWTHRDYSLAPGFQLLSRKQRVISRASNRVNCLPTTSKRNWCGTKRGHGRRSRRRGGRRASNGMSEKEETKRERETRRENFTSLWKSSLENKRLFSNYYPTTSSSRIFFIYALFATRLLLSRPPSLRKNLESAKDSCDRCLRDRIASRRKGKENEIR